jgi:hypothetical protein
MHDRWHSEHPDLPLLVHEIQDRGAAGGADLGLVLVEVQVVDSRHAGAIRLT